VTKWFTLVVLSTFSFSVYAQVTICEGWPVSDSTPLFSGTIFEFPELFNESDHSAYLSEKTVSKGRGNREMFDRRVNKIISNNAFLFSVTFQGEKSQRIVEVGVNSEFGTEENARTQVEKYMTALGRIPFMLLKDADTVWIHKGNEGFGGGNRNYLIHTEMGEDYIRRGILEDAFLHEGVHTSFDQDHYTDRWKCIVKADGQYISDYAKKFPSRENHAESLLAWLAVRYGAERVSDDLKTKISQTIPNQLKFYDKLLTLDSLWPFQTKWIVHQGHAVKWKGTGNKNRLRFNEVVHEDIDGFVEACKTQCESGKADGNRGECGGFVVNYRTAAKEIPTHCVFKRKGVAPYEKGKKDFYQMISDAE
jgi:hypothetical protein